MVRGRRCLTVCTVATSGLLTLGLPVRAQSLLERAPNVSGAWVGAPGSLQFNFLHRFTRGSAPTRKVVSSPSFLVAAGLPWHSLVGYTYSTNSDLTPRYPNEWEFFARYSPFVQESAARADIGVQGGYNLSARSVDGELSAARWIGPLRVLGAARVFSDAFGLGQTKSAIAAGGVLKLGRFVALAGDYASVMSRPAGYRNAWGAALQFAIPYTPHTVSLQATNANTATLQGSSASRDGQRRYGFEFTIPVTLGRYVPRRQPRSRAETAPSVPINSDAAPSPDPSRPTPTAAPTADSTQAARTTRSDSTRQSAAIGSAGVRTPVDSVRIVPDSASRVATDAARGAARPARAPVPPAGRGTVVRASMRDMTFRPLRIQVAAGATVIWSNSDAMVHTLTSDDGQWSSGAIEPGTTWRRRFDRPGTYTFHCTPHPFMKGVVVVR